MAKDSNVQVYREICRCFYDETGEKRPQPVGRVASRNLNPNNLAVLGMITDVLMQTNLINDDTKEYLRRPYITMDGVNELINTRREMYGEKPLSQITTRTHIANDIKKVDALFGKDIIKDLMYSTNCDVETYRRAVSKHLIYKKSKEIHDATVLIIPDDIIETECDEEDFQIFLETLRYYTKKAIEEASQSLDRKALGYFNYITSYPSISDKDKENLRRVEDILGIEGDLGLE